MNFYEILEIDRNSSTKEIKKHYLENDKESLFCKNLWHDKCIE